MEGQTDYSAPGEYIYDDMVLALPWFTIDSLEKIKALETTIEDVCIATYPKSGTTWTQQILAQIYPEVCPTNKPVTDSIPFVELTRTGPGNGETMAEVDRCQAASSPRLFKTHLPARYFQRQVESDQLKVIFVIRNLKDTLVSYFHHYKSLKDYGPYPGDWSDFFGLFRRRKLQEGYYFDVVPSWLRLCERSNVLLVRYEDLKKDLVGEMRRISKFCGRDFSGEDLEKMAANCTFSSMKSNPKTNYSSLNEAFVNGVTTFMRRGVVGDWKNYFTNEQLGIVHELIAECSEYLQVYSEKDE